MSVVAAAEAVPNLPVLLEEQYGLHLSLSALQT